MGRSAYRTASRNSLAALSRSGSTLGRLSPGMRQVDQVHAGLRGEVPARGNDLDRRDARIRRQRGERPQHRAEAITYRPARSPTRTDTAPPLVQEAWSSVRSWLR